jgi:hypothetical protein
MPRYADFYNTRFLDGAINDIVVIHDTALAAADRPKFAWFREYNPADPENQPRSADGLGISVSSRASWLITVNGLSMQIWAFKHSLDPVQSINESTQRITLRWARPAESASRKVQGSSTYHLQGFDTVRSEPGHDTEILLDVTNQPSLVQFFATAAKAVKDVAAPKLTGTAVHFSQRIEKGQPGHYYHDELIVADTQEAGYPVRHRVQSCIGQSQLYATYSLINGETVLEELDHLGHRPIGKESFYSASAAICDLLVKFGIDTAV